MAKILVVDDEEAVRHMLRDMLEREGHEILEANTGLDAADKYHDKSFDLVITDLVMPEKSGIDLIMELKNRNPGIRIVAISGGGGITGRFDYLPIAKLIGAKAIIRKPFQMDELRDTVDHVLAT